MRNIFKTLLAVSFLSCALSSLYAEDTWPPVRPWTDPWGDARFIVNPWDDDI